jgi:hypothetical protein
MTEAVAVTAEAATEAAKQENNEYDDEYLRMPRRDGGRAMTGGSRGRPSRGQSERRADQ